MGYPWRSDSQRRPRLLRHGSGEHGAWRPRDATNLFPFLGFGTEHDLGYNFDQIVQQRESLGSWEIVVVIVVDTVIMVRGRGQEGGQRAAVLTDSSSDLLV